MGLADHDRDTFGSALHTFRKRSRLTQTQLAEAVGVHRHEISRWEQGDVLPASKAIVLELARCLHLDEQEGRLFLEASMTAPLPLCLLPRQRNPLFTGRQDLLDHLHRHLQVSPTETAPPAYALQGLGGVGKTQIALEYAFRFLLEYRAVFWIEAETLERVHASFQQIAETLHLPERTATDQQQVVKAVQHWLATHPQWLLIWDNLEDLELPHCLLPPPWRGALLLTTRSQALGPVAQGLAVRPMGPEDGLRLLLRRAKMRGMPETGDLAAWLASEHPAEAAAALQLLTLLGGLPLALDQAGAYMEETGCGLLGYLQRFERQQQHLLGQRGAFQMEHPQSVTTTLWLAGQRVAEEAPEAYELLLGCAFVSPDAIPEALFEQGASALGPVLGPLVSDDLQFDRLMAALGRFSLIQRHPETHTLSLHRLVQEVLKSHLEVPIRQQWVARMLRALAFAFPDLDAANWPQCEQYLPHIQRGLELLEETHAQVLEAALLFQQAGRYLFSRGRYQASEPLLSRALALQEQQASTDPSDLATTLKALAELSWGLNQEAQALEWTQRALTLCEAHLGPDHPQTAANYNNLAILYWNQSERQQAQAFWERALAIRERSLGPDHLETAESFDNLAFLHKEQGNFQHAERFYLRSLEIHERQLGTDHPETAVIQARLGVLYIEQARFEEAEPLLLRCVTILKAHDHPSTAFTLQALGRLKTRQEAYAEAETWLQEARVLHERRWKAGPHSSTAQNLLLLGTLYAAWGKDTQAEPLLRQALAMYEALPVSYFGMIADCLKELGWLYHAQHDDSQALRLLEQAWRTLQGYDGPDRGTAEGLLELASLAEQLGQQDRASQFRRQASLIFAQRFEQTPAS